MYRVCSATAACEVACYSGGSRSCIPRYWLCDGIIDCDNNWDENPEQCGQLTTTAASTTVMTRCKASRTVARLAVPLLLVNYC